MGKFPAHDFDCHCEVSDKTSFMNLNIVVYKIGVCQNLGNLADVMKSVYPGALQTDFRHSAPTILWQMLKCYVAGKASTLFPSISFIPCLVLYYNGSKCHINMINKAQISMPKQITCWCYRTRLHLWA